jgi:S-layer homology domain
LACAATDERSYLRPQDGDANQVSRCDKGAFELCPLPFTDVPAAIAPFVADLFCRGLASGCSANPPRFCTSDTVTRAQMAVLLIGALGEQPSGAVHDEYFGDVPDDAFAGYINRLYELGITAGCGPGTFCPDSVLSRKQMAVFLVVAMEERPSSEPYDRYFNDLAPDVYAPYINRLFELGITGGCGNGAFCPNADTIRGDLAVFLGAAFFRY